MRCLRRSAKTSPRLTTDMTGDGQLLYIDKWLDIFDPGILVYYSNSTGGVQAYASTGTRVATSKSSMKNENRLGCGG